MNSIQYFENLYKDFIPSDDYDKFKKHIGLILLASSMGIALCGSTAVNVVTKKPSKIPADIDFVTDSNEAALTFLTSVIEKVCKYKWYGKIQVQNGTNFCFKGTLTHYKFNTSFGFNICVMVLKDKLKSFYTKEGLCVQFIEDLKLYTELASSIDGKQRDEIIIPEDVFNN